MQFHFFFTPGCPGINLSLPLNAPRVLRCRSLSTRCYTKSTQSGVDGCRKTDCTPCGWPGTHPSPTWASVQKIQLTSWCTTCSCSASLTRLWYANTVCQVVQFAVCLLLGLLDLWGEIRMLPDFVSFHHPHPPLVAAPWSKGHVVQSDDTAESPGAGEDQTEPCF